MWGDLIDEASGRISGAKVHELSGDRRRSEVGFQGRGKLGETATTEIGTCWPEIRRAGALYGEGGPLIMTDGGELVAWKGFGVGKPTGPGFAASH